MKPIKVKTFIIFSIGALSILLALFAMQFYRETVETQGKVDSIRSKIFPELTFLKDANTKADRLSQLFIEALSEKDSDVLEAAVEYGRDIIQGIKGASADLNSKEKILDEFGEYIQNSKIHVANHIAGKGFSVKGFESFHDLKKTMDISIKLNEKKLSEKTASIKKGSARTFQKLLILFGLMALVLMTMCVIVLMVFSALGRMGNEVGLISSGDLNHPIKLGKIKEIRILQDNFERMRKKIKDLLDYLDHKVKERTKQLEHELSERHKLEAQLLNTQKMEAVGQLAAGIAHEINTPVQFIGSNTSFLREGIEELKQALEQVKELGRSEPHIGEQLEKLFEKAEVDYLLEELPKSIDETLEGVERVTKIVQAFKEFSHPGRGEKELVNVNKAVSNSVIVSQNTVKTVAVMEENYAEDVPEVLCNGGALKQVVLNIIVNAAHTIKEANREKGLIKVSTFREGNWAGIKIEDNGTGMTEEVKKKVFNPFFTTKPEGKGTGQGMAIAYDIIINKHKGKILLDTELGQGTVFQILLPLKVEEKPASDGFQVGAKAL